MIQPTKQYKLQDFQIIQTIDTTHEGNTVLYAVKLRQQQSEKSQQNQQKAHPQVYVLKSITKSSFKDDKSVEHVKNEKECLLHFSKSNHPGVNHIRTTFQDPQHIYMVLQLVQGLPLHKLLQMTGPLNEDFTRLIVTQVGLLMKDFHKEGYIYRDVKSSNFMINQKGKVTLIDLGKAKLIQGKQGRTYTVCGTTHSMPPEVYSGEGYGFAFDYYSFGVLVYELLVAKAPFGYENFSEDYLNKIKNGLTQQILEPIKCQTTKDLIRKLLAPKQSRLGLNNGFEQILQHQYFNCPQFLDYKDILQGQQQINKQDDRFSFYISEIVDFGLEKIKYQEIKEDDPFYKFFG